MLLLDEPTNDLDVDTLRALEEALEDYAGCAVIISHDRWFLDRIATHILAFEGDSHVEWFEGNFAGLRGRQEAPPRHRFHDPAPDQVQEVHALTPPLVIGQQVSYGWSVDSRAQRRSLAVASHCKLCRCDVTARRGRGVACIG